MKFLKRQVIAKVKLHGCLYMGQNVFGLDVGKTWAQGRVEKGGNEVRLHGIQGDLLVDNSAVLEQHL